MTYAAWIALVSLFVFTMGQVVVAAWIMGGLFARVRTLEGHATAGHGLAVQVATLAGTVGQFERQLELFNALIRELLPRLNGAPRRRRADDTEEDDL